MSLGAGIAVVGIWAAASFIVRDERVNGGGMCATLLVALAATFIVSA